VAANRVVEGNPAGDGLVNPIPVAKSTLDLELPTDHQTNFVHDLKDLKTQTEWIGADWPSVRRLALLDGLLWSLTAADSSA
jgi:hypothetical protein